MRALPLTLRALAVAAVAALALSASDVWSTIQSNPQFSIFASLAAQSNLNRPLSAAGPYSVFVPTNDAFAKLPNFVVNYYNASVNSDILISLLAYHIVVADLQVSKFIPNQEFLTAEGDPFYVEYVHGSTNLGLASITCQKSVQFVNTPVTASNGMVQAIDTVMFPQSLACPNKLFWVESQGIQRVGNLGYDCRSTGFTVYGNTSIPGVMNNPTGLAVDDDVQQQMVFWSNDASSSPANVSFLSSVTMGSQQIQAFLKDIPDPRGMDTEHWNITLLYFASHAGHTVYSCVYDGSYLYPFWTGSSNDYPVDVAVDIGNEIVFIAVQTGPDFGSGYLLSTSIWQTNTTVLMRNIEGLSGICLDKYSRLVYLAQSTGSISCYAYGNVSCPRTQVGLPSPYACAVDNMYVPYGGPRKVAFTSPSTGSIHTVDMSTGAQVLVASDLSAPTGVKFGCIPRESNLLPLWKINAELFADAMLNSTQAIMAALFPGAIYRVYPAVTTQEEPEVDCPAYLLNYAGYIVQQGKAFAFAATNVTDNAIASSNGGSGAYSGFTAAGPALGQALSQLTSQRASISAGGGASFGVSIQCTTNNIYTPDIVLFSYAMAVGGGNGPSGGSFAGGGAAILTDPSPYENGTTVSGGGSCGCSGTSCSSCNGGAAAGSTGNIPALKPQLLDMIKEQCNPGTLMLCVTGMGQGGWSGDVCEYGAGYGVSFQSSLILDDEEYSHLHQSGAYHSAAGPALCAVDPQALAVNSAVDTCSSECYGDKDYNACYCNCFQAFLVSNEVPWANNFSC